MSARTSLTLNKSVFNPSLYSRLLTLWFADLPLGATAGNEALYKRWYVADTGFDSECQSGFRHALDLISPANFPLAKFSSYQEDRKNASQIAAPLESEIYEESDEKRADTTLSLVLLLDQIPRNVFRDDQALIYGHYDRLSRALVHSLIDTRAQQNPQATQLQHLLSSWKYRHSPVHRTWLCMPLMHSEDIHDHDLFEALMKEVKADCAPNDEGAIGYVNRTLNFEKKHRDIIEKFGRYPHRNDAVGRATTDAERKWIDEGGDTFGTKSAKV